jgi:glycosyltransferase involved in cell wall biosynthesis
MRILMLSDVCFPRVNGVSTSIQTFRQDLASLGHNSLLIAPDYPSLHDGAAVTDLETLRIVSRGVPRDPEDRFMSKRAVLACLPQLRAAQFDIVHVQTPFVAHYTGVAIAKALGVPVVETYHTYFEHYLHHYVPALPRGLMRWIARRFTLSQCAAVSAVISPSRAMAEALRDYGVATRIDILPTGLDPGRFQPGDAGRFRARHGIDVCRPVALFVGRVAHEKNIDFLLRMFVRVRQVREDALLIIAGEGPAQGHCRKLAQQLQLADSVKFIGYMDRNTELLDCYRAADAFVFASRTETQGLVLLEALAQGTPVVSTAVMGTADVLQGTRGSMIVDEDESHFAAAVIGVIGDPARRAALASHARGDALNWSSRAMAQRLVNLYADVIESSQIRNGRDLKRSDTDTHGKHLATTRRSG